MAGLIFEIMGWGGLRCIPIFFGLPGIMLYISAHMPYTSLIEVQYLIRISLRVSPPPKIISNSQTKNLGNFGKTNKLLLVLHNVSQMTKPMRGQTF